MNNFVKSHHIGLLRALNIAGILLCLHALFVALTFDVLYVALIRAGLYSVRSWHWVAEGIAGGLLAGLTASAWRRKIPMEAKQTGEGDHAKKR